MHTSGSTSTTTHSIPIHAYHFKLAHHDELLKQHESRYHDSCGQLIQAPSKTWFAGQRKLGRWNVRSLSHAQNDSKEICKELNALFGALQDEIFRNRSAPTRIKPYLFVFMIGENDARAVPYVLVALGPTRNEYLVKSLRTTILKEFRKIMQRFFECSSMIRYKFGVGSIDGEFVCLGTNESDVPENRLSTNKFISACGLSLGGDNKSEIATIGGVINLPQHKTLGEKPNYGVTVAHVFPQSSPTRFFSKGSSNTTTYHTSLLNSSGLHLWEGDEDEPAPDSQPAQSGGLFGNSTTTQPQQRGLFGESTAQPAKVRTKGDKQNIDIRRVVLETASRIQKLLTDTTALVLKPSMLEQKSEEDQSFPSFPSHKQSPEDSKDEGFSYTQGPISFENDWAVIENIELSRRGINQIDSRQFLYPKLHSPDPPQEPNTLGASQNPSLQSSQQAQFVTEFSLEPPENQVLLVTRRGILRGLGLGRIFSRSFYYDPRLQSYGDEWGFELLEGNFEKGDSGSWVIDAINGNLYGILVSALTPVRIGTILPARAIQFDLWHNQYQFVNHIDLQERDHKPANPINSLDSSTIKLYENSDWSPFELLPSSLDIFVTAARNGDLAIVTELGTDMMARRVYDYHGHGKPSERDGISKFRDIKKSHALDTDIARLAVDASHHGHVHLLQQTYLIAARHGYFDLLDQMRITLRQINTRYDAGGALQEACRQNHTLIAKYILENDAEYVTDAVKRTVVVDAFKNRNLEMVQRLLNNGIDIKVLKSADPLLINMAVEKGWIAGVELLLSAGVPISRRNLRLAVNNKRESMLEIMLKSGTDLRRGDTLRLAASQNWTRGVEMLLKAGADPNEGNPLHPVILQKWEGIFRILIENGADVKKYDSLEGAVSVAWKEGIEILLNAGADPNEGNPLHSAILQEWEEGVRILVEHGADVNKYDALGEAISLEWKVGIEILLRAGAYSKEGNPLRLAISNKWEDSVRALAENGADVNKYNALGDVIPLKWKEGLEILIKHGADPNKNNALKETIRWKWADGVDILLRTPIRADVKKTDKDGNSPILLAVRQEWRYGVERLIEEGADVEAVNDLNKSPLEVAVSLKWKEGVEILLKANARVPEEIQEQVKGLVGHL